jgi:putative inorganic carbon (HCO3(-)) transporter
LPNEAELKSPAAQPRSPGLARAVLPLAFAALLGASFAVALHQVWNLEGRWFIVTLVGIAMTGVAMMTAGRFSDFAFILLLFSVPLAGLAKFTFLNEDLFSQDIRDASLYSGTLGIGIVDMLLVGLYGAWAFRIFVQRSEPWPRLEPLDAWVGFFLLANLLSQWGAVQPLAIFAFEHQLKHALVYFYVSRHFRRKHLPWLLVSIGAIALMQSIVGILQNYGAVPPGLILDKGSGERLEQQYRVPGIEDIIRATGTLYDSHALGTYLSMMIPFMVVFLYKADLPGRAKLALLAVLGAALVALVVTYSRSAWLGTVISTSLTFVALIAWHERHVGKSVVLGIVAAIVAGPFVIPKLFARLFDAPIDLLLVRFEQFPVAWSIWRESFLFGAGAGNYMHQAYAHNTDLRLYEPVHNVALFIGAEMGVVGVLAYYGMVVATVLRLISLARRKFDPWARVAVASAAGIASYIFDGMSNPIFREPTIYMWFWVLLGLATALTRIVREERPPPVPAPGD